MKKIIYLDHAATTYLDPEVEKAMRPFWQKEYGNPSSALHSLGRQAKMAIDQAREEIAKILKCKPSEIIFTAGGTESINLALFGIALAYKDKGKHIITSQIEHHAVLNTLKALEKQGFKVTYLKVDKYGLVDPQEVKQALRKDTILVSIMYANNEIGTIEPIKEIGKVIIREVRLKKQITEGQKQILFPFFYTDACQAAGACDLNLEKLGVDLLTLNGSKIYGPKQTGLLYLKKGVKLEPLIYGGGQEGNLRSGTENVPGIVGLARALKLVQRTKERENQRLVKLRDKLIKGILEKIPKSFLNGHPLKRLPNNVNVSILGLEGEALTLLLDDKGICASTGSACTSLSLKPSHVITSLGLPYEYAHGSIRFTLGKRTKEKDIDYLLKVLPKLVERLRKISPVKV